MTYMQLVTVHLATIIPAIFLGAYLLSQSKGTGKHRAIGKLYMSLMVITAGVTLFMPAYVGPQLFNHFGIIHILSFVVFFSVGRALYAARQGDIKTHRKNMVGLYVGGILVAGVFTLSPGRLIHGWLFG
ncbi:hypothetical protein GCM10011403_16760 [Pseudohongiella nitratireducens]|uniref:DUF2306 domain-containing protein n=2 Tax=Pseudohongiella nitratireducens TaxID=1768907 RepID=A0A917GX75_9GAMM|nr:DUF2306 domain-containing protein [Pseudohongiella nitratireducens]GGG60110.1 hypothetical protein GCM10011403_16760 [Pseudohongiella nitratireducens]